MKAGNICFSHPGFQQPRKNASPKPPKGLPAGKLFAKKGAGAWLQSCTYCIFPGSEENQESSFEMLKLSLK
jgi:hypothetical protein